MRRAVTITEKATAKIADLRALLDWLEQRPLLADKFYVGTLFALASNADEWRAMLDETGTFDKNADDDYLNATRYFGSIKFQATAQRSTVCEQVQIGERTVEREVYPADVKTTTETVTEPVYEWECPPSWLGVSA